jgi:lysyl-tRNA synthetase, class II
LSEQDNELVQQRKRHLQEIARQGIPTYTNNYSATATISATVASYQATEHDELAQLAVVVRVPGRIRAIRQMGKAAFITYSDGAADLQIYLRRNEVGEDTWQLFNLLDLGDIIGAAGKLFRTKTNELSIHLTELTFLAKALLNPPDKYYGLHDKELRYRQRYVDLMANRDVRQVFTRRAQIIRAIRQFFDDRQYLEVETPMLTPLATGAAARPFITHHNALDITLYARIAPELYLKRLVVGGFDRVYEINRNFRNEGLSIKHNPEFTMLEFYQAYSNYQDLLPLTEELISSLVQLIHGSETISYNGRAISFAQPWQRLTMREAVIKYWPEAVLPPPTLAEVSSLTGLQQCAARLGIDVSKANNYGQLLALLFDQVAEPQLWQPTFITEFPTEISPLSKQSPDNPQYAERFELFIAAMEVANGFSELNDPAEQRHRFEAQMQLRATGDDEAMVLDEDFLRALSYAMPPTAGEGIGIDRVVMLLTDQHSIRDVILFPHMRPERGPSSSSEPSTSAATDDDDFDTSAP